MKPNAYTTMQRARSLSERHPDASPSAIAVALALATFADGPTGTSIRPGHERIAQITGLHLGTVKRCVRWLVQHGELRRDKRAWRGSAACYTWIGGMGAPDAPPIAGMGASHVRNGGTSHATHLSHPLDPSGLPGPQVGEAPHPGKLGRCSVCTRRRELVDGWCAKCHGVMASGVEADIDALIKRHQGSWKS